MNNSQEKSQGKREEFLAALKDRIGVAFANRKVVVLTADRKSVLEDFEERKADGKRLRNLPDDTKIVLKSSSEEPHEVFVDDLEEYKDLLRLATEKIAEINDYSREWIERNVENRLAHESKHSKILKEAGLVIRYGVVFLEGKRDGSVWFRPQINASGTTNLGVWRKVAENEGDQSEVDKVFITSQFSLLRKVANRFVSTFKS